MPRDATQDACAEVDNFAVYSAFDRCHHALGTLRNHGSSLLRRLRNSQTADVTFFRSHNSLRVEEAVVGHRLDQSVLGYRSVAEVGRLDVDQIRHELLVYPLAMQSVNEIGVYTQDLRVD
jgi:hypothetical protein